MTKSILISIKPRYVVDILNHKKTIEVRKCFPKDYKGWVYIYCTKMDKKGLNQLLKDWKLEDNECWFIGKDIKNHNPNDIDFSKTNLNGKVVARFYCDKVEEYYCANHFNKLRVWVNGGYCLTLDQELELGSNILYQSNLTFNEFDKYVSKNHFFAIHISQLEIFDEPKELGEFHKIIANDEKGYLIQLGNVLTKAPQSYQWIEVGE